MSGLLLVQLAAAVSAQAQAQGKNGDTVIIEFTTAAARGKLEVHYRITNRSKEPILVFDRKWDRKTKNFDPDWAYVDITGNRVILKRGLELLPKGTLHENPEVPFAREVASGATASASFSVPLPLEQASPYDYIVKGLKRKPVSIERVELQIGWSPKSEIAAYKAIAPAEMEGQRVWHPPYYTAAKIHRTARAVKGLTLAGIAAEPRESKNK